MPWNPIWPEGGKSVRFNETNATQNTAYTETTMNLDHHWNISGTNDGHHKHVQMIQTGTTAAPLPAALAAGMEGVIFLKNKTATESPTHQSVEPFYINNKVVATPASGTDIMQLLGIRAMAVYTVAVGGAITLNYCHNIGGITRASTKVYTATFSIALPSENYVFFGGATSKTGEVDIMTVGVLSANGAALTSVKSKTLVKFVHLNVKVAAADPLQGYFICFGG